MDSAIVEYRRKCHDIAEATNVALRKQIAELEQRNLSLEVFAPQIDKLEDTEQQLEASQTREQQLREALEEVRQHGIEAPYPWAKEIATKALANTSK